MYWKYYVLMNKNGTIFETIPGMWGKGDKRK
jgi:hypothetical protein